MLRFKVAFFLGKEGKMKIFNWDNKRQLAWQIGLFLFFVGYIWFMMGWARALIFVPLLVIHEMGHLWMMERFGIKVNGVYFTPFGAIAPAEFRSDFRSEAWIGIMGPLWGFGSAVLAFAVFYLFPHSLTCFAVMIAAFLNLFNLIPLLPMDGGRVARALTGSLSPRWSFWLFIFFTIIGFLLVLKLSWIIALVVIFIGYGELKMEFIRRRMLLRAKKYGLKSFAVDAELAPYLCREPLPRKDKAMLTLVFMALIISLVAIIVGTAVIAAAHNLVP